MYFLQNSQKLPILQQSQVIKKRVRRWRRINLRYWYDWTKRQYCIVINDELTWSTSGWNIRYEYFWIHLSFSPDSGIHSVSLPPKLKYKFHTGSWNIIAFEYQLYIPYKHTYSICINQSIAHQCSIWLRRVYS